MAEHDMRVAGLVKTCGQQVGCIARRIERPACIKDQS
jgi:hypothetical protein